MAVKKYSFVDSDIKDYIKEVRVIDGIVNGSETNYSVALTQAHANFGPEYYYYKYTSSGGSGHRVRAAYTYASVIRYSSALVVPEPSAANKYVCEVNFPMSTSRDIYVNVCVLNSELPTDAKTAYNILRSLSPAVSVLASGAINITLTLEEMQNVIKYGIALVPVSEAQVSDISDYINVTANGEHTIVLTGAIKNRTAAIEYSVENLASPGKASLFIPSQASILVANSDNKITWTYTHDFGASQYYVGITATHLDTGETVTICKKEIITAPNGSTASYTIPADTIHLGRIRLAISVMPQASASYYSDSDAVWLSGATVEYTVKETPEAGNVSCDGKPNPTVSWKSSSQAAYQVRFGDYDSGVIAGNNASYTVPRIFGDGNYPVSIRTATADGEWSDWTEEIYVTITNIEPAGNVLLTAEQSEANIKLSWTTTVSAKNYAVYRDNELIAVTAGTTYIDRYSNGRTEYFVRAVTNGYYKASETVVIVLKLRYDLISDDGGYNYKLLKYTPNPKSQNDTFNDGITYQYYSGREKPIAILSGKNERVKYFTYAARTREELLFLRKMRGKAILIKTTRGCVIYGIINDLQYAEAFITTVSFAIREIFREGEVVDYV